MRGPRASRTEGDGVEAPIEAFRIEEDRPDPRTVVLEIHGEADLSNAAELEDRLKEVIDQEPSSLVLDLSGATFLDSMTLGVLLNAMKRLRAVGGKFRIVVPRAEIRRIFEMTLLDRIFALDGTRREALLQAGNGSSRRGAG
jgi:anti-sigma B factor antagonist